MRARTNRVDIVIITTYSILATEFLVRYAYDKPIPNREAFKRGVLTMRTKVMLGGLIFNTTCLFIR